MSQPAICSGVAGCPKPKCPLGVDIAHLPIGRDSPGLDGVVVIEGVDPARLDELRDRRLHVAGLVDGPTLELGRLAVPRPGQAEARPGDRSYGFLQGRWRP